MERLDIKWDAFKYYHDDETDSFEDMCRSIFKAAFLDKGAIMQAPSNLAGIEVLPIQGRDLGDGTFRKRISFQSKFTKDVGSAYPQFRESAETTVSHFSGELDRVYIFNNNDISTGSKSYKEIEAILTGAGIEAVPISGRVLLDMVAEYPDIARRFFPEKTERYREAFNEPIIPQCLTSIPLIAKEIGLVGREDILGDIRKMLDESSCIVLVSGLGGIGKTAVMQGVCNDIKDDGYYVAWINCGDSLQDDLLMLRDAFGVPKEEKADKAYESVKAGIQRLGKKLYLFMDDLSREVNKEERNTIYALGVHVMITSRRENLPFRKEKLGCLAEQDAIKMFYGFYGGDGEHRHEGTVRSIIESVNSHTLLVELLAKAANEEGGTLDDFYETLKNDGFFAVSVEELEAEHDDENLTIEESVIKLFKISKLSEEQQRVMKLFTIFTPEKEIYYKVREWAGFDRKEMKKLVDLGWLERGGLENGYHIHQIIKDSLARQVGEVELEDYGEFLDKVFDTDSYLGKEVTYEIVRERIVLTKDVAGCLWNEYQANREKDEKWIREMVALINNLAVVYYTQGDYGKALEYYGKTLTIHERVLGTEHPDTANIYNNMALVFEKQGNYGKALEYYGKTLTIHERVLGTEHPDTAETYNNMAVVYYNQGDYGKALKYYGKTLTIRVRVLGKEHPDTAETYNNMAMVFQKQGDYRKALEYYSKALAICEHVLGKEHPDTAKMYNNKAVVYQIQGDYGEALKYYGKALTIHKRVFGTEHPDTAKIYNNMTLVYQEQGDYGKALEYNGKALSIQERVIGTEHPDTARSYHNMAVVYSNQGDYGKALKYFGKALAIKEQVLGTEHLDTANTYNNMALVYQEQGDYEKALKYCGKALAIKEQVLGTEHPDTSETYNNMALVYQEQGDYEKALEYCDKVLAIRERVLGKEHPDTAGMYNNMAVVYQIQGEYGKALKYYGKALTIYERVLGTEHPDTAGTYNNIAMLYQEQGDYGKALGYYKRANSVFLSVFGEDNTYTRNTQLSITEMERLIATGMTEDGSINTLYQN